jgi:hypothetical protein
LVAAGAGEAIDFMEDEDIDDDDMDDDDFDLLRQ